MSTVHNQVPQVPAQTYRVEVTVRNNNTKEIISKQDVITYEEPRLGKSKAGEVALVYKPIPEQELRFAHEAARYRKAQAEYDSWRQGGRVVADQLGIPDVDDIVFKS